MDLKKPLVSVLMSIYGEPIEWIKNAIDSILSQSFKQFEYIIVNDNPQRNELRDLLENYTIKDPRIRVIANSQNVGLTKSLNIGLNYCNGKYVARMDADDWSYPNRLKAQYDFMESHPELIASSALAYSWNGETELKRIYRPTAFEDVLTYTFTSSPFIHPLLILRNDLLRKYNIEYDESFRRSQDYKLAVDLLQFGKIANLSEYLLKYRISNQQITYKFGREQVELCKIIRRCYVNQFYRKHNLGELDICISKKTIRDNMIKEKYLLQKGILNDEEVRIFKRQMNSVRRLLYYSLNNYSLSSLASFLFKCDYLYYPYNVRRFFIVVLKHIKSEIVPKLL